MENSSSRPPRQGQTITRAWAKWRNRLSAWLIEPGPSVQGVGERSRARLLAVLLLVIIAALLIRNLVSDKNRGMFLFFILVSMAAYGLVRTRYYPIAIWIIIANLTIPSYLQTLALNGQVGPTNMFARFAWLAFAIVLCGLIQSDEAVALLTGLNLLGMLLIVWWLPGVSFLDMLPAMGFVVVLGVLVITATRQRAIIEQGRQAQELIRERQLNEVSRAISRTIDLPIVLETAVRVATELTQAGGGLFSLLAPEGDHLEQVMGYHLPETRLRNQIAKGQGVAWQIIQTRQPIILDDYSQHANALAEFVNAAPLRGYLGVPILSGADCLGALSVASVDPNKHFSQRDLELLEAVALQAGIAVQNARLYHALENELAERKRMELALHQRDAILEAVAQAAGQFLQSQNWHLYVQTVLAELGQITHSSHAYIFQNHLGPDGNWVTSQIYQWAAPEADSTLEQAIFQNMPLAGPGLERWRQAMLQGEPFYGGRSSFLTGEQRYLAPNGALSILEMPIYLRPDYRGAPAQDETAPPMDWWGLIGFDDYSSERQWSQAEIDAIRIAASILSGAIQRQRADQAIREREDIYRRAISAIDAVPYYTEYYPTCFIFIGEGILNLTGYSPAEMTVELWNQCVQRAIPLGEAVGLTEAQALQIAHAGRMSVWNCDYLFKTRSGDLRWINDTGVELIGADNLSHGCIGIFQDITNRKIAEESVRQVNIQLEKWVQERTAALEMSNKELESFSYSVSHDLRAPLRAIDGYSRILQEDYRDRLGQDGRECLDNIHQSTQKMNQLIDDLLELSRVTRQEMKAIPVDLSQLAEELLEMHRQQEPERDLQARVQPGLSALGDPNLLRIALGNLLDNAWKFTRKTPAARIEFGCTWAGKLARPPSDLPAIDSQTPVFYVQDNGAGFDMKYAAKLFQAFQRLHTPLEFEGTGIGLVTIQRIIRRHHGRIWAEGAPNQGATFYFTIDAPAIAPPAADEPA